MAQTHHDFVMRPVSDGVTKAAVVAVVVARKKKKRSSRRILNFEGMKAVCLVICAHFTYTSSPGYPQKDGLFHGNSIYKWMSWRDPHDLGNLHIDKNQYIHHIDGILLISSTYITAWLVVSTPLKNITQWEGLSHILWKKV